MPVWGVWDGGVVWFSSSNGARKSRNIAANPGCVVTTSDPNEPVVVEGLAERVPTPRRSRGTRTS